MRILVIDRSPPCNLLQGNALIGRHLFSRLRHHHLTLICPAPSEELEHYRQELSELFDAVHLVPRDQPVSALAGLIEPTLARSGLPIKAVGSKSDVASAGVYYRKLQEILAHDTFDVIHTRQLPMTAMSAHIKHPCKLLELIDSETLQAVRRVRKNSPQSWVRYRTARFMEQRAISHFQACTTVADADADVIRRLAPGMPVYVTPNGVDADYYTPLDLPEKPNTMIFTGAMSFPPNVTAVLHFYQHILPLIRRELPEAHLVVAGRNPAPSIEALASDPHVTVTGFVEDMRPWLAESCVMLCPMTMGSGIKNKVLEAMAMARPVVTTSLGVEALDVTDGREVRIADEPQAFANAVLELLRDQEVRRRVGQKGHEMVLRRYTWDACATSYDEIYEQLVTRHGHVPQLAV